jgi:hypothetical protein
MHAKYHAVISNPFLLNDMKRRIHKLLDLDNTLSLDDIYTLTNIDQIFYKEVEQFFREWWELYERKNR